MSSRCGGLITLLRAPSFLVKRWSTAERAHGTDLLPNLVGSAVNLVPGRAKVVAVRRGAGVCGSVGHRFWESARAPRLVTSVVHPLKRPFGNP